MDRALAQRHGTSYVHASVFAIDVDRVRDAREARGADDLPFAWEVFLTEAYLLDRLDPEADPDAHALLEDLVLSAIDRSAEDTGAEGVLGSQLPFAVWDAIARGAWPSSLRGAFASWQTRPGSLVGDLAALWDSRDSSVRALARACLDTTISPPLAPPTIEALERMAGDRDRGERQA